MTIKIDGHRVTVSCDTCDNVLNAAACSSWMEAWAIATEWGWKHIEIKTGKFEHRCPECV